MMLSKIKTSTLIKFGGAILNFISIYLVAQVSVSAQAEIFIAFALGNLLAVFIRMGQGNVILKASESITRMNQSYIDSISIVIVFGLLSTFCLYFTGLDKFGLLAAIPLALINLSASYERARRNVIAFSIISSLTMPLIWLSIIVFLVVLKTEFSGVFVVSVWTASLYLAALVSLILCRYELPKPKRVKILVNAFFKRIQTKSFYSNFLLAIVPFLFNYAMVLLLSNSISSSSYVVYEVVSRVMTFAFFPLYAYLYTLLNIGRVMIVVSKVTSVITSLLTTLIVLKFGLEGKLTLFSIALSNSVILFGFVVVKDAYLTKGAIWKEIVVMTTICFAHMALLTLMVLNK